MRAVSSITELNEELKKDAPLLYRIRHATLC
jgi:hypothetical protein